MKYWEWAPAFDLDPKKTALLIIDMQNGFVEQGAPPEVPMDRSQIPVIQRLLHYFRTQNLPVLFTAFCVAPDLHYPFY
jgi:ureidoacrylate peracid hydrolase